jgi:hypothetical protein
MIVFDLHNNASNRGHLGIRPSGNPPPQKVPPHYEGVGSIPRIFKIDVCVSLD